MNVIDNFSSQRLKLAKERGYLTLKSKRFFNGYCILHKVKQGSTRLYALIYCTLALGYRNYDSHARTQGDASGAYAPPRSELVHLVQYCTIQRFNLQLDLKPQGEVHLQHIHTIVFVTSANNFTLSLSHQPTISHLP